MPVDKYGQGPATYENAVEIGFEVWDQELTSHAYHLFLADAIDDAIRRNEAREKLENINSGRRE